MPTASPVLGNKITITGKVGPGNTVTALVLNNVVDLDFNCGLGFLSVTYDYPNVKTQIFELAGMATVTYTIANSVATVVVST